LTSDALKKHNAIHIFGHGLGDIKSSQSEISITKSLQDVSLYDEDDDDATESGVGSFKTFQTFASDWSACSNTSFTRYAKICR
jgi:ribosomal RNA-processing protein 12